MTRCVTCDILSLQRLDYEFFHERGIPAEIDIHVTVTDGGSPPEQHTATALVKLTILGEGGYIYH